MSKNHTHDGDESNQVFNHLTELWLISTKKPTAMGRGGGTTVGRCCFSLKISKKTQLNHSAHFALHTFLFFHTAKYLAWGWCTIIAEVLCSGTISMVSVRVTPIVSGRSIRNSDW